MDSSSQPEPLSGLLAFVDRRRWWLLALVGLVYLLGFNGQWNIERDTAAYAELGRNLAEGKGYTYHDQPHRTFEPGLPWLFAITFRLFGVETFWPMQAVMFAMALGSLALTWVLLAARMGRAVAVLVVFIVGLNERFYIYAFELMTDMPFTFGALLFLVGYERLFNDPRLSPAASDPSPSESPPRGVPRWLAWVLLFVAVFMMTSLRIVSHVFLAAAVATAAWQFLRGRQRARHVILCLVILLGVGAFKLVDPRRGISSAPDRRETQLVEALSTQPFEMAERAIDQWIPRLLGDTVVETVFAIQLGPGISEIVSLAILASCWFLFRKRLLWGMVVLAFIVQMLIFVPRSRYFLPFLPLLILAILQALRFFNIRHPNRGGVRACAFIVLIVILVPNLIKIADFVRQQRRIPFLEQYDDGKYPARLALAAKINEIVPESAAVIAEDSRILSFFSRRHVIAPSGNKRGIRTGRTEEQFLDLARGYPAIYVVMPLSDARQRVIDRLHLDLGRPLETVDGWTLHLAHPAIE